MLSSQPDQSRTHQFFRLLMAAQVFQMPQARVLDRAATQTLANATFILEYF